MLGNDLVHTLKKFNVADLRRRIAELENVLREVEPYLDHKNECSRLLPTLDPSTKLRFQCDCGLDELRAILDKYKESSDG